MSRLTTVRAQLGDLQEQLGRRQELANRTFADDTAARAREEVAQRAAAESRTGADRAAADAERARRDIDAWVTAWFQQADVVSPFSVLAGSSDPADVGERAYLRDAVTTEQLAALDAAELSRVAAANADSRARASARDAADAANRAGAARVAADAALADVRGATDTQLAQLRDLTRARDGADAALRELEAGDAALTEQRRRAEAFEADTDARTRAADDTTRAAATVRLATGRTATASEKVAGVDLTGVGAGVRGVLDRALSQLGTVYAWGGGDAGGPSKGIRDGGVADSFGDFDKTGFDCSGLMIYAFAGADKELPHYSGYQATAGSRVPLAQRKPGDLLFWADGGGGGAIHHVALYLGGDKMIEAPESGKVVRVTPVRFDDEIVGTVTRLL